MIKNEENKDWVISLFNNEMIMICKTTFDGIIIDGNNYLATLLGFKDIDKLIKANYSVNDLYENENDRKKLRELLEKNKRVDNFKFKIKANGRKATVLISSVYEAKTNTINTIIKDITEKENSLTKLKEKEKRLIQINKIAKQSNKAKSTFLSNMSHEFRTPMNSILGMTELLLKTDLSKKQFNFVNVITKSAENLLVIINDILDFSKIESGELVFENISFRLKDVLADVVNSIYYRAKQKNIELICNYLSYGGNGYILKGDSVRLTQILINLVDNAVKFTEKGKVEIIIEELNKTEKNVKLKISIKDTGIGIEKENIKKILRSFTQADLSVTRKYGGTGLGLTISKHLIKKFGGKLCITSEKNIGSVFSFEIEMEKGNETEIIASKEDEKEYNISLDKNIKILLAEDEPFNQIVVKSIVEEWGFDIDIADNGNKALELLSKKHFDLIFMDIQMPELDGLETTKIIRTEFKAPINAIPIIAITANAYTEDHKSFYKIGINEVISKPFKSQILFNKIVDVLKIKINKKQYTDMKTQEENKIYNLNVVKKITKGNSELIIKMLSVFKEQASSGMADALKATNNEDWEQVGLIIHKLKPSVTYLGMSELETKMNETIKWCREKSNYEKIKMNTIFVNEVLQKVYLQINDDIKELQNIEDKTLNTTHK